ncbi:hypothetical protein F511_26845 [Dorcoceras hygrometricum]|uniref:Uncharacterized protein n=1 Tax=Dorcoceras hygrometricum TaxID=472368 RepID=A0A2Z7D0Y3_9LAMI|nr:hypothetical protein F511_26845 [Dorcoceras hygrometricum]
MNCLFFQLQEIVDFLMALFWGHKSIQLSSLRMMKHRGKLSHFQTRLTGLRV